MEKRILTQEATGFKNVFDAALAAHEGNYKISDIAKSPLFVSTISQFEDTKKVKFVISLLSSDFRSDRDYAFYYGLLQNMFKKKMKMTDDDIYTLCDIYRDWFDIFDAVGIKGFVTQALKNVIAHPTEEIHQVLRDFRDDIKNADIRFAPQRASTRDAVIDKLNSFVGA